MAGDKPAAVLFDKDGTLVDLRGTWDAALGTAIEESAVSSEGKSAAFDAMEYDPVERRMAITSPFVAEPIPVIEELLAPHLDLDRFADSLQSVSVSAVGPAPGVDALLTVLEAGGVPLVVVTNDAEQNARLQMASLGWSDRFVGMLGADSGFGGKPDPAIVERGCDLAGAVPSACWMIGDSVHDILAGRRAGCRTLLVTNGEPPIGDATDWADIVVASLEEVDLHTLSI